MTGAATKTPLTEQIAEAELHMHAVAKETDMQLASDQITQDEAMQRVRAATAIVFTLDWLLQNESRIKAALRRTETG